MSRRASPGGRSGFAGVSGRDQNTRFCGAIGGFADSLSRVLHGPAGISAKMSLQLADVLGTHAAFRSGMQMEYEFWQAGRKPRAKILPFGRVA